MTVLGIDIGGSGIKGAPVDVTTGMITTERYRVETPQPANVKAVIETVGLIVDRFPATDRVGIAFPGVVADGITATAANLHESWVDAPAAKLFETALGRRVTIINDADAAGIAEMTYGAGRRQRGVAVLLDLRYRHRQRRLPRRPAATQHRVRSPGARRQGRRTVRLGQGARGRRAGLATVGDAGAALPAACREPVRPDLFIIGGGVSKKAEKFLPLVDIRTPACQRSCSTTPASSARRCPHRAVPDPVTGDTADSPQHDE